MTWARSRYAGALVLYADEQQLRRALAFERKFDSAAFRVAEGVADDLRHGGRDARLILPLETQAMRRSGAHAAVQ